MKKYIQFFQKSAISEELIVGCGDRSIIRLDGREAIRNVESFAKEECLKRGYLAYQFIGGSSLLSTNPLSPIVRV